MKYLLLFFAILISGCSTTPKTTVISIPAAPYQLLNNCPKLTVIDPMETNIINFSKTVLENYTKYHDCSNKVDSWIDWYNNQKSNK